jgi:tRNA threonylcarbamoyladenosine biosynthesis protein TsaB
MKILAIETSTEKGSLALLDGSTAVAHAVLPTHERHSAGIIPILDSLLGRAGWTLSELAAVGAGLGPGSFTGIRVGLAVARGLSFSLGIPLKGVGSFEALAWGAGGEGRIAVLADARRGRIYCALYEKRGEEVSTLRPPACLPAEEAARLIVGLRVLTPQRERLRSVLGADVALEEAWPDAFGIGRIAGERMAVDPSDESSNALPLYLNTIDVR